MPCRAQIQTPSPSLRTRPRPSRGSTLSFATVLSLCAAGALASPPGADAQLSGPSSSSFPALGVHEAGVELFRPRFKMDDGISMGSMSGGLLLAWGGPISRRTSLRAELPVAWGSMKADPSFGGESKSGTVIGNPALSVRAAMGDAGTSWLEGTVRLPVGTAEFDNPGILVGIVSDPVVLERWVEEVTTLSAGLGSRVSLSSGIDVEVTGSVGYWFDSGEDSVSDPFGRYAAGVYRVGPGVTGSAVFRGLIYLGEGADDLMDRLVHTIEGELGTTLGLGRVSTFVRVPLKDFFRETSPFTLGLRLSVPLG